MGKNSYISPKTAKELKRHNSIPPRIYGLPKLHKQNVPLRPIVSCIQSPLENVSKFLKSILQNIINRNNYYIKDSWHFRDKMKNKTIPEDHVLVSLDVVSLYTNIPTELALEVVEKRWNILQAYTSLPLEEFLDAVRMTLTSTYFAYEEKFYRQVDGCAMGASISSVIAQLVLEDLEEAIISQLDFTPPFFYRYVDDCILAIPNYKSDYILNKFNSYHPKLRFTIELQENNQINFLDMTLHNEKGKIRTAWYTKHTWSGRYINFSSQHPVTQKKSVIAGLADRAIHLSDPEYRQKSIKKAKEALLLNNYPVKMIDSIFKKRIHRFYNESGVSSTRVRCQDKKYLTLPYVAGLSERIHNTFKNRYENKVTVSHRSFNLLGRNFSNLKTPIPKGKRSNIVYEIPCKNCNGVYIGQTYQYLKNRLNGHRYDKKNKTALTGHETEYKHKFDYDKTRILRTETNKKKREIYEMIYIQKNENAINSRTDTKNLSKIYYNLIKQSQS